LVTALELLAVEGVLHTLTEANLVVQAVAPVVGLALVAGILRVGWRTSGATSDEFVEAFHTKKTLEPRRLVPKLAAAISTIGLGGALGLEGPAMHGGATIGQSLDRRRFKFLAERDRTVLLVAGAAAGVAAVFKAPATGVLFALEAPYRRDIARAALIPSLVAAAAAYLTLTAFLGSERLLDLGALTPRVTLRQEVLGAIVIGLLGGLSARALAALFHWAKDAALEYPLTVRLPVSGAVLAAGVLLTDALVGLPATLGPGAELVRDIILVPSFSFWTILALFGLRSAVTAATLGGGGVGGVFIPLVVQGLLLGRCIEIASTNIFDTPTSGLYPVIALAAVLGAGYRTPLAAVMFVAETTGRAEFVIPALVATAISQAVMGDRSVSVGQVDQRSGVLEQRLKRQASAMVADLGVVVSPDRTLVSIVDDIDTFGTQKAVAVGNPTYQGVLVFHDVASAILSRGMEATAGDAMRQLPAVAEDAPATELARAMSVHDTTAVAVVDAHDVPLGVVTAFSLAGFEEAPEPDVG